MGGMECNYIHINDVNEGFLVSKKCVSTFCVVPSTKNGVTSLWKLSNGVEGYTPKFCQAEIIQSR